jgi:DNA-binding transcriptional regulator GbsR (MarR family)
MAFELQVMSHSPMTEDDNPERVAQLFFQMIGYTARKGPDHGISFKVFYECFLLHPQKNWTVEELAAAAETTMPSVYRHLNKLKDLDIIEDHYIEAEGDRKRAFRLRYGDFSKAWNFAEAHFQLAIENYRKTVDHMESLLRAQRGQVELVVA